MIAPGLLIIRIAVSEYTEEYANLHHNLFRVVVLTISIGTPQAAIGIVVLRFTADFSMYCR